MVSKGFPKVTISGRQYNIGEKPSVILYTYINLHAGTPKPQSFLSKSPGLQYITITMCDGVLRCLCFVFNVFMVSLHGD